MRNCTRCGAFIEENKSTSVEYCPKCLVVYNAGGTFSTGHYMREIDTSFSDFFDGKLNKKEKKHDG